MKKQLPFLMLLALVLTACTASPEQTPPSFAGTETGETRTITDAVGREVTIPAAVDTIVPLGNTPRMISYLGLADRVVGIPECCVPDSPIMAAGYVHREAWDALPRCGTDAMGETAYYAEEIMLAQPDVILCTYTADVADNLQAQTGIPTVAVSQGTLFGDDYDESLRLLGDVCGVTDRAEEVIAYIDDCLEDLSARTVGVADGDKPTVLAAGATFKGGHSIDGVYLNYPVFSILHARDVAVDVDLETLAGGVLVDREQILAWAPEMIFFDSGSMELVRSDYAESPGYFQQLRAVADGRLYQWPNSTWHWSNVEIPLVTAYFTGTLLYPEQFADINFEEKAGEIFDFFLGEPDYLQVLAEAGAGYGPVTLP